ncbi:hypothetical protein [Tunicatimonas pelagia]|uniref:hypothetical protein n=1 Tax=Tunicatimonas pelagia TaxID=931531 RepID=UPI00266640F2|nr:hypothetical protein [Tunicatimonas pelagia]WKN41806.1 hypothetical protein P0M28_22465 [Tunicatimonas pelagia]
MAKSFKRAGKVFGKISLDLIPVIIGILAALLINDYRQKLQEQKRQAILLNNLVDEFAKRRDELNNVIKYRQLPLLNTLEVYINNSEIPLREIFQKAGGFGFPEVYVLSWESALNSQDTKSLDFILLNSLSRITSNQQDITSRTETIYDFLYSPGVTLYDSRPEAKELLDIMLNDFVESERTLISRYDEFIQLADSLYDGVTVDSIAVDSLAAEVDTVSSE